MCDCIERIEKQLTARMVEKYPDCELVENVEIQNKALMLPDGKPSYYAVYAETIGRMKKGKSVRKYSPNMSFRYCPFCGEKYENTQDTIPEHIKDKTIEDYKYARDIKMVDEYISTVDTVSSKELQRKFGKSYAWAYKMVAYFKNKGRIVLNDVFGNYRVINE